MDQHQGIFTHSGLIGMQRFNICNSGHAGVITGTIYILTLSFHPVTATRQAESATTAAAMTAPPQV
jgi:hypothetical protein